MRQVNIHAAKTHLSRLVDEAVAGEEVVIARNGKPIVRRAAARRPRSRVRGRGRLRLLLDTHVLLWWLDGDSLRPDAQAAIAEPDNAVSVSAATIWEISAKHALGRLRVPPDFVEQVAATRFARLAITDAHG